MMKHILIVGGTGMIREATTHFIEQGHIVSIMSRDENRVEAFRKKYPRKKGRIWPIVQDYSNPIEAVAKVQEAAKMFVRIDLAILWIHDTESAFSERVKRFLFSHNPKVKVFQLLGSTSSNPMTLSKDTWKVRYPNGYREIFLGYHKNDDSARWLTNREISEGTIDAVEGDHFRSVIGEIEP